MQWDMFTAMRTNADGTVEKFDAGKQLDEDIKEDVENTYEDINEKASEMGKTAGEAVKQTGETVKDFVTDAVDAGKQTVTNTVETVAKGADDLGQSVANTFHNMVAFGTEQVENGIENGKEAFSEFSQPFIDALDKATENEKTTQQIHDQKWQAEKDAGFSVGSQRPMDTGIEL